MADFECEFPSLCFALATGVGKTRLMGTCISYLHLAHGINNFFVLAPNLTIYNKLIADITPGTPKYVFKGITEVATDAPGIITGDNYESRVRTPFDELIRCARVLSVPLLARNCRLRLYWEGFRDIELPLPAQSEQRIILGYLEKETGTPDALRFAKERTIAPLKERRAA